MRTSIGMHAPVGREARQPWMRAALFVVALAVLAGRCMSCC